SSIWFASLSHVALPGSTKASAGRGKRVFRRSAGVVGRPKRVLMLVENLPVPFDRRVWQEAATLRDAGYVVSIICPTGKGHGRTFEIIDDIHIWRYGLPLEGDGPRGYAIEYAAAMWCTWALSWKVFFTRGFDVIHACN